MILKYQKVDFLILIDIKKWISNIIKWIFYKKKKSIIVHISLPHTKEVGNKLTCARSFKS